MRPTSPRQAVEHVRAVPRLVEGTDERFTGYGVMGVPFASGHYLALRDFVATSIGPAYRSIWHRTPDGRWEMFTTAAPELSCPRYFGARAGSEQVPTIDVEWVDDRTLQVTMGERLSWRLELASTPATRMMTAVAGLMPQTAWESPVVLAAMNPMAGTVLGTGKIKLHGLTPNGPTYKGAPLQVWRVVGGRARLDGEDLGDIAPLAVQDRLGDFWMPQRGLFFVGRASFSPPAAALSGS